MTYRYKLLFFTSASRDEIENELNARAAEGWRLKEYIVDRQWIDVVLEMPNEQSPSHGSQVRIAPLGRTGPYTESLA